MSRHAYAYVQMHIYLHHHIPWIIQNNCFSIPITSQFNLTVHFHTVNHFVPNTEKGLEKIKKQDLLLSSSNSKMSYFRIQNIKQENGCNRREPGGRDVRSRPNV